LAKTRAKAIKYKMPRDPSDLSLDELAIAPLRCFEPCLLDIRISGRVEVCNKGAQQLVSFFLTK
jgi:hypothetical protein